MPPPSALGTEAVQTSETSVNLYQSTRRYNPEDGHLPGCGDQSEENEMGEACSMHEKYKNAYTISIGKSESKGLDVNG
jgi:hypothetical protein